MVKYSALALLAMATCVGAFAPQLSKSVASSELNALPPMIIGPMIKKMREEEAKKKMPMASSEESKGEAPGLRVGSNAWKWPPVWPYDQSTFMTQSQLEARKGRDMSQMASAMNGASAMPVPGDDDSFDPIQYWGEEKIGAKTTIDEAAKTKLTE